MKVTVSGIYRTNEGAEVGANIEKIYSVSFEAPDIQTQSELIKTAAGLVKDKDPKFVSLKTHKIEKGLL